MVAVYKSCWQMHEKKRYYAHQVRIWYRIWIVVLELYIWSTHSVTVLQSQRTQHNVNSFQCNVLIYRHEFVFDFCARACKIYVRYRTKEMIFRCMNKKESCNRPSHHKLQLRREWIRSFSIALLISFSNAIV